MHTWPAAAAVGRHVTWRDVIARHHRRRCRQSNQAATSGRDWQRDERVSAIPLSALSSARAIAVAFTNCYDAFAVF